MNTLSFQHLSLMRNFYENRHRHSFFSYHGQLQDKTLVITHTPSQKGVDVTSSEPYARFACLEKEYEEAILQCISCTSIEIYEQFALPYLCIILLFYTHTYKISLFYSCQLRQYHFIMIALFSNTSGAYRLAIHHLASAKGIICRAYARIVRYYYRILIFMTTRVQAFDYGQEDYIAMVSATALRVRFFAL